MNRLFTAISSPPQRSKPPSAPRAILRHDAPTSATAFLQQLRADDGVVLGDADTVLHKLQRMYQGGLSSLHIVTDFGMVMEHLYNIRSTPARLHIDQVLGRQQAQRNVTRGRRQQPATARQGVIVDDVY